MHPALDLPFLPLLSLLLPLTFATPLPYVINGSSVTDAAPYVINGSPVTDVTSWPWQGSLGYVNDHLCGCVLISNTWVLTAAHCAQIPVEQLTLRFGSLTHNKDGISVKALSIIVHEGFGEGEGHFANDIALIKVSPLTLTDKVKPITMTTTDQAGNEDCYITGWGYTQGEAGGPLPTTLHQAHVNVYTTTQCEEFWAGYLYPGHVCAGDTNHTKGICTGDTGGPLACRVDGQYQLVGLGSWTAFGCEPYFPSVFSRISYFRTWIRTNSGV